VSGVAISLLTASPAFAQKCDFSPNKTDSKGNINPDYHERDPNDPPLRCKKCEEIAARIAKQDANVWTLDLKYGKPKRIEVKKELGTSDVYWYVYYEVTNNTDLERPCFIDVAAESDKGKNTYHYHDMMVPECKEELRKILGIKADELLYTSEELRAPGVPNKLPNKDSPETRPALDPDAKKEFPDPAPNTAITPQVARSKTSGLYEGGNASIGYLMIKPGETKKCVALFGKLDPEFDFLTIYFYGLCNTTTSNMPVVMPDHRGLPKTDEDFERNKKVEQPDSINPEANPVAAVAESEKRLVNDSKIQEPVAKKAKVIERIFCIEYSCTGDEFAKTTRPIVPHEDQPTRPRNLERDETKPAVYHDVGLYGTEIVEPEDATVEGNKKARFTYTARKWIQTEKVIASDLR